MTAVRAGDVEGLLRRGPDPRAFVILVYGPDTGLAAARARHLAEGFVADPGDPFALVRLDGDALGAEPGRLADEAGTFGLFGAKRAVWVRAGQRNIAPAVEAVLAVGTADTRVVVEAGDLGRSAPLRVLCERSASALALPCYPDDERTLADLVERTLAEHGLRIDREARDALVRGLGGDRRASLAEIEKLALYAHGRGRVGIEDVEAVASDAAGSALNTLVDAAFEGRPVIVERDYRRHRHEGQDPATLLGAALRHGLALLAARLDGPDRSAASLAATWRGLHFKRKGSVEAQLARWTAEALGPEIRALQGAILACRRAEPGLADALAGAALLRLAAEAARRGRRS